VEEEEAVMVPKLLRMYGAVYVRASTAYQQARQELGELADLALRDIREGTGGSARADWAERLRTKLDKLQHQYGTAMSSQEIDSLAAYVLERIRALPLLADDPARPGIGHRDARPEPVTRREPLPKFPPVRVHIDTGVGTV
jgi:hypothetical protein